jgi:hypothetical protein
MNKEGAVWMVVGLLLMLLFYMLKFKLAFDGGKMP